MDIRGTNDNGGLEARDSFEVSRDEYEGVFRLGDISGEDVLRFFRGVCAPIGWIRLLDKERQKVWGLLAKPESVALRDGFGLHREVLVLSTSYRELQARVLSHRQRALALVQPSNRVQEDLVLVITDDPDGPEKLRQLEEPGDVFLALSSNQIMDGLRSGNPSEFFKVLLQNQLYARDFFDRAGPVQGREFFGRSKFIQDVVSQIRRGNHLGMYGLRKVGKTSIIKSLIARRNSLAPELILLHIDLLATPSCSREYTYLLYLVAVQLRESLPTEARSELKLKLLNKSYRLEGYESIDKDAFTRALDSELRVLLPWAEKTKHRVVLVLDEIEELFPSVSGHKGFQNYNEFLAYVRGLSQSVGPITLMVVGVNPNISEAQLLGKQKNPMFGFFSTRYVPPLAPEDTKEMLRVLGRSSGVKFEHTAVEHITDLLGGHPFLTRRFCSLLIKGVERPAVVSKGDVEARHEAFLRQDGSSFAEMVAVVQDFYPDEFDTLQRIAIHGRIPFEEIGRQVLAHLEGYQLVEESDGEVRIRNRMMSDWLGGVRRKRLALEKGETTPSHKVSGVAGEALEDQIRCVELGLRDCIREVLDRRWGSLTEKRIRMSIGVEAASAAEERMGKSLRVYGERPFDLLDFLYLGELNAVISGHEWCLFREIFKDKREFERNMRIIAPSRSEVQHFRKLPPREALRAQLAASDLLTALEEHSERAE